MTPLRGLGTGPAPRPQLELRPANENDSQQLFQWANDPEALAASFNQDPIPWLDHVRWFQDALGDPSVRIFIAEEGAAAVGQVRLSKQGTAWEVSLDVDPRYRGSGRGAAIVKLAARQVQGALVGRVKETNRASRRTFESAGFTVRAMGPVIEYYLEPR